MTVSPLTDSPPPEETRGPPFPTPPKVSIGLPVYNGIAFLEESLNSILEQSFEDFELVISDNGSDDGTSDLCRHYMELDPRIRYYRHPVNQGAAANYNFALVETRADYFKWATHDDVLEKRFLQRCVEELDAAPPEVVLVYPRTLIIDAKGRVVRTYDNKLDLRMTKPSQRLYHLVRNLTLSNPLFGLLRKQALLRTRCHGTYNEADRVMLAELAMEGQFWEFEDQLFLRRIHPDVSTARTKSARQIAQWFDPSNRRKFFLMPKTRLFLHHFVAIGRNDLPLVEKAACLAVFLRASWYRLGVDRNRELARQRRIAAAEQANDLSTRGEFDVPLTPEAMQVLSDLPPEPRLKRSVALHRAGRLQAALQGYDSLLAETPELPDALQLKGALLSQLDRGRDAMAVIERGFDLRPDARIRGEGLDRILTAIGLAERFARNGTVAYRMKPGAGKPLLAWGEAMLKRPWYPEALLCFERLVEAEPNSAYSHYYKGVALQRLGRHKAAIESLRRAAELPPELVEVRHKLSQLLNLTGDSVAAAEVCRWILDRNPDDLQATGNLVMANQLLSDWRDSKTLMVAFIKACEKAVKANRPVPLNPSFVQNLPFTQAQMQVISSLHAARTFRDVPALRDRLGFTFDGRRRPRERLRIGYLSEGFRNFPTSHLIQGLFEKHDRSKVEVVVYSYGPDDGSSYRKHIAETADRFVDLRTLTDPQAAQRIYSDEIDILLDLKGYTSNARPVISALRPAPVQIGYLGFPGTMGYSHLDYILVDRTVVPHELVRFFNEKPVYLPNCYQVTDDRQAIAPETPSRQEHGLPDGAFVFCCFNKPFKLDPATFGRWMQILLQVPDSVLWLIRDNGAAVENLRREASERGVDPQRLVFAPSLPKDEHLARHRHADLFLDAQVYNAHTTGTDALWTGLPMVTTPGHTFQSRVAASLLANAGLPELIAPDPERFVALAVGLARDPEALARVREKLRQNLKSCPLFDTAHFARGLELVYRRIWDRYCSGEAPQQIAIRNGDLGRPEWDRDFGSYVDPRVRGGDQTTKPSS